MKRRALTGAALAAAAALSVGCAALNSVTSDVASYGEWPAGRPPGSYAFERLPSQQARAAESEQLEATARHALEKAGFKPAAPGAEPDVLVQVGARISATVSPWDDPLWWRGGFGFYARRGVWLGPRWSLHARYEPTRYEREVGLLLRDRASGKPLYEARASSEGNYSADASLLAAMFDAALADFPRPAVNPRRVTIPLASAR